MSLFSRKMLLSLVIVSAIPSSSFGNYRGGLTQLSSAEISLPNHDNTNTTDRNQLTTKSKFRLLSFSSLSMCVCVNDFFFCFLYFFQYSIDDSLPFILNIFLAQAFGVAGTVVITCYGLPWFVLVLVPLVLVYYFIQNYYRRTSR